MPMRAAADLRLRALVRRPAHPARGRRPRRRTRAAREVRRGLPARAATSTSSSHGRDERGRSTRSSTAGRRRRRWSSRPSYGADLAGRAPDDAPVRARRLRLADRHARSSATPARSSPRCSPVLRTPERRPPVVARPLVWYNPDLSSARFLVPGLVAFILMVTSVIATALAVVREKERGTMESLRATPLVAIELLVGKTLPYLLLASVAAAGSLTLAWALFDVPIRGSLVWLGARHPAVPRRRARLGHVLISTLADTQQVAFQLGLLSSMLPTLLLSGFIFPISSMPPALQVITHIVPGPLLPRRRCARSCSRAPGPRCGGTRPSRWSSTAPWCWCWPRADGEEPVSMRTLLNILVKELLQLRRDPKILPILFIAPVVQLDDPRLRGHHRHQARRARGVRPRPHRRQPRPGRAASPAPRTSGWSRAVDAQRGARPLARQRPRPHRPHHPGRLRGRARRPGAQRRGPAGGRRLRRDDRHARPGLRPRRARAARGGRRRSSRWSSCGPRCSTTPTWSSRNFMVPGVLALILMIMTMMLTVDGAGARDASSAPWSSSW